MTKYKTSHQRGREAYERISKELISQGQVAIPRKDGEPTVLPPLKTKTAKYAESLSSLKYQIMQ